ncbi:MAG: NUDIX domain-containing protein [Oscillospiraceae bacterium]|nr:NUDIX domain-containing protein [Oscillospiraceae bacterium]
MVEYVDIYDEALTPLGSIPKSEAHVTGAWHKSFHCWILRSDTSGDYVVIQKRNGSRFHMPNKLDISAAGHYQAGEAISDGVREIEEELGLAVPFEELLYLGIQLGVYKKGHIFNREFCYTFLCQNNQPIEAYSIDCDEVSGLYQIAVQDGLDLFCGRADSINAAGIEYLPEKGGVVPVTLTVERSMFTKATGSYYGKIFMLAKAYFKGERDLFI